MESISLLFTVFIGSPANRTIRQHWSWRFANCISPLCPNSIESCRVWSQPSDRIIHQNKSAHQIPNCSTVQSPTAMFLTEPSRDKRRPNYPYVWLLPMDQSHHLVLCWSRHEISSSNEKRGFSDEGSGRKYKSRYLAGLSNLAECCSVSLSHRGADLIHKSFGDWQHTYRCLELSWYFWLAQSTVPVCWIMRCDPIYWQSYRPIK